MRRVGIAILAGLAALAGCSESPLTPDGPEQPAFTVNGAGRLPVYNGGLDRSAPRKPCMEDERYRAFDFWVGEWDLGGGRTSRIESLLDGCVILEQFRVDLGVRGRSINTYDRDTGLWHQTWAGSSPFFALRMSGEAGVGTMDMHGERPSVFGPTFVDDYHWVRVSEDEVVQSWEFDYAEFGSGAGSLTYIRADIEDGPPSPLPGCREGAGLNNTLLDFMHGDWTVERENGLILGTANVVPQSSGCVTTMQFATPKGYGAIAYTYWDAVEGHFFRTYIDSEAERIELRGSLEGDAFVLEGTEPGPDGREFLVRVIIRQASAARFTEEWEVSADGGTTWTHDLTVVFVRD